MRRVARSTAGLALVALGLSLAAATAARAQHREFTGQIREIDRGRLVVDNRMGDEVVFHRVEETGIDDQRGGAEAVEDWSDLRRDDWVSVRWRLVDTPRVAYEVIVLPPRVDASEDP